MGVVPRLAKPGRTHSSPAPARVTRLRAFPCLAVGQVKRHESRQERRREELPEERLEIRKAARQRVHRHQIAIPGGRDRGETEVGELGHPRTGGAREQASHGRYDCPRRVRREHVERNRAQGRDVQVHEHCALNAVRCHAPGREGTARHERGDQDSKDERYDRYHLVRRTRAEAQERADAIPDCRPRRDDQEAGEYRATRGPAMGERDGAHGRDHEMRHVQ